MIEKHYNKMPENTVYVHLIIQMDMTAFQIFRVHRLNKDSTEQITKQIMLIIICFYFAVTKWLTVSNNFQYRRTNSKAIFRGAARMDCQNYTGHLAGSGITDATIRK